MKKKAPQTSESSDDEDDETGEEAPKKKLKVIHIIIIIALAFIVLYDEVVPPEEPATPTPKITPKYKKKKVAPKKAEPVKKDVVEEPTKPIERPVEPKEDPFAFEQPKEDVKPSDDEFAKPKDQVVVKDDVESELDALFDDDDLVIDKKEVEKPSVEVEKEPDPIVKKDPSPSIDEDFEMPKTQNDDDLLSFDDDIINKLAEPDGGEEITTAILEQLEKDAKKRRNKLINNKKVEPTDPPTYLAPGSGLVYNCVDKHWACVDASSFKLCGDNYAWRLKKTNSVQCYPSEFYDTEMDCASMQQYKIDMTAATEFCQ
ncbi:MAG: hypothetical protein KC478_07485 [Bacteriovoracaceae bacterium]|nr:hypothetical protein [Bacteriovoracaceae bacterium]